MAARRRLPASLRMTSSDVDVTTGNMSTNAPNATTSTTASTTPPSPGAVSTYSSAEGPGLGPANTNTGSSIYSTSSVTPTASPWNPVEAMSRTQQKLNLQRDSSHDDLDEQEMTRREKMLREMERIQREYKCIRMTADPVLESMTRCLAVQKLQQQQRQRRRYNDGALGLGVDEQQKQRSL
ncbi:MAG: hypothetical protein J3R72DRAFT_443863 [Linnemannia gamsii]|nr:MAG: hypothetical protein J3R72DRAFT_443863 [Linnemannia gamsii]